MHGTIPSPATWQQALMVAYVAINFIVLSHVPCRTWSPVRVLIIILWSRKIVICGLPTKIQGLETGDRRCPRSVTNINPQANWNALDKIPGAFIAKTSLETVKIQPIRKSGINPATPAVMLARPINCTLSATVKRWRTRGFDCKSHRWQGANRLNHKN